jgi:hypothetical protein
VLSPGDNGPVTQSIASSAAGIAGGISSVLQDAGVAVAAADPVPSLPAEIAAAAPPPYSLPALPLVPPAGPGSDPAPQDPASLDDAVAPPAAPEQLAAPAASDETAGAPQPALSAPPAAPVRPDAGRPQDPVVPSSGTALVPTALLGAFDRASSDRPSAPPLHAVAGQAPFLPPQAPVTDGASARISLPAAEQAPTAAHSHAHRPAAQHDAKPTILALPSESAVAAASAAAHGGGSSGGGLAALALAFMFLSPGLTRWLRVGTERRPRLLRAGRRERPG